MDARCSHLRRGWFWGTQAFGEKMHKLAAALMKKAGAPKSRGYGKLEMVRKHGERQAEQWLAEGLKAAGIKRGEVRRIKGSDARKVLLADVLWCRTVVSDELADFAWHRWLAVSTSRERRVQAHDVSSCFTRRPNIAPLTASGRATV